MAMPDSDQSPEATRERLSFLMRRMRLNVSAYEAGRITFRRLVRELKLAIEAMHGYVQGDWLEEWRTLWGRLEIVNAIMINQNRTDLTDEDAAEIGDAIEAIVAMSQEY